MRKWTAFVAGVVGPAIITMAAGMPGAAMAQAWPTKPIRIVIAQALGSATDVVSRVVGNRLGETLGQPIVIEARPGAGGMLGTEVAARSAPDGYTLFMGNNSTHGSNPALYSKLPYDAVNDFAPIIFVGSVPYALVVASSLPVNSVPQLVAYAKSRPGKINYASAGNGSTHHFAGELLKSTAGIDMIHVPYKGSSPAVTALISGEVSLMFLNVADGLSQIRSGKVRALAVTTARRSSMLADVPTLAEVGMAGFEIQSWFGLLAPAGTPRAIIARVNSDAAQVLGRPDVRSTLNNQGLEVAPGSPEQFAAYIKREIANFSRIAKAAGIKAE